MKTQRQNAITKNLKALKVAYLLLRYKSIHFYQFLYNERYNAIFKKRIFNL
jgi:hypothetical protein